MEGLGVIQKGFWRGKRVFITGHTGFKGAWLSLWLEQLGAVVTGYSVDIPTEPSLFSALTPWDRLVDRRGDVRDLKMLSQVMKEADPEVVFHLAAQSLVRPSYADPVSTYATNVMGTVHLLEAARSCGSLKAIVNVTSDKCYDNRETATPYREQDPFGGKDPYSSSKGCAEIVTAAYRSSFFSDSQVGLASARAGNVIGGGDWSVDRLVPDCVRAFIRHESVSIRNPLSTRPWQHVLDALRGYLILAQCLHHDPTRFSEGFNFGPEATDTQPVSKVVSTLCALWGEGARCVEQPVDDPKLREARALSLDSSHAHTSLGWKQLLTLPEALAWTAAWYKAYSSGAVATMRQTSIDQLTQMMAKESAIR
jgi:CDP-glucose 4,6-dehydratase